MLLCKQQVNLLNLELFGIYTRFLHATVAGATDKLSNLFNAIARAQYTLCTCFLFQCKRLRLLWHSWCCLLTCMQMKSIDGHWRHRFLRRKEKQKKVISIGEWGSGREKCDASVWRDEEREKREESCFSFLLCFVNCEKLTERDPKVFSNASLHWQHGWDLQTIRRSRHSLSGERRWSPAVSQGFRVRADSLELALCWRRATSCARTPCWSIMC